MNKLFTGTCPGCKGRFASEKQILPGIICPACRAERAVKEQEWTYKQLCQALAETEYALRTSQKGFNTHGRHDQLKYMQDHFPSEFDTYLEAWQARMALPVDMKTILESIPDRVPV